MNHLLSAIQTYVPEMGGYFNPVKVVVMAALALPWLWGSVWTDKDTRQTRMPRSIWLPAVFGGGVLGMLVMLLTPVFIVGVGVYVVIVCAVGAVYVMQRNSKVIPEARVLTAEWFANIAQRRRDASVNLVARLKVYDHAGQPAVIPADGSVQEKRVYNQTQDLLYDIMWRRASEVDVSPSKEGLALRYVIDGLVNKCDPLDRPDGDRMLDYLKTLAGMDVEQKRRPQTGKISVDLAGQQVDIDIVAAGTTSGPRMQLKIVQEAVRIRLGELGIPDDLLAKLRELNNDPSGLIIVASQRHNGLTSTLYSLMRDHDAYTQHLMTIEAKAEADLENVTQNTYDGEDDQIRVIAAALRRDPNVVMIDRCPTATVAERVLDGVSDKKIVLGIHARDSFKALAKWVQVVGEAPKAVKPLQAVLSQVLVRKLCPACREAYQPNTELLRKANLPADKVEHFYRPPSKPLTDEKGRPMICPTCQGSGYFGRTAAFELLVFDDAYRKLIASGANLTQIKAGARKNKMLYLQEQALRLVMEGVTSVQEVIRVTRIAKGQG